jgi:hypothetical protein
MQSSICSVDIGEDIVDSLSTEIEATIVCTDLDVSNNPFMAILVLSLAIPWFDHEGVSLKIINYSITVTIF